MLGNCNCKNLILDWQIKDFSLIPRACQCQYCLSKNAAWLAKPGSTFSLAIRRAKEYQAVSHGTHSAQFHECLFCGDVVAVTSEIDDIHYGLINVTALQHRARFPDSRATEFIDQSLTQRLAVREQNWSYPVTVTINRSGPELRLVNK